MTHIIRFAARGSLLSRTQTGQTAELLRAAQPGLIVEIVTVETTGDLRRDVPFGEVGTKGMFVKEIEQALLEGRAEVGLHSLKDMPSELPTGLKLSVVPRSEDPRDALITLEGANLMELPAGAVVGTGSIRRQAQLRHLRPDLKFENLRGNLDTRMRRLHEKKYDAIVLAAAGLSRLGLSGSHIVLLAPEVCLPAVGQGALALEIRTDDVRTEKLLLPLNDSDTFDRTTAERAFQAALGGGCSVPVGALAKVSGDSIVLEGVIAEPEGVRLLRKSKEGPRSEAKHIGRSLAEEMLLQGGAALLRRE